MTVYMSSTGHYVSYNNISTITVLLALKKKKNSKYHNTVIKPMHTPVTSSFWHYREAFLFFFQIEVWNWGTDNLIQGQQVYNF